MRKLELDDVKKISLEVLCEIRNICIENNISYSLTGGTLIGAIRHQGFIPWDDDIDIMIPRKDYEKFLEVASKKASKFNILSEELLSENYNYPFAKACHRCTMLIENSTKDSDLKLGVYVDVFPVDGIGKTYVQAKLRTMVFQFLHGLKITSNWNRYHKSKLRKWYYEPFRYICYLISRMIGKKHINNSLNKFVKRYSFEDCKYAGRMVGDFGSKEVMNKEIFLSTIKVKFEGEEFDAIKDYHTFLTNLYGDYMKLPPKEKQITHHEFQAYWID